MIPYVLHVALLLTVCLLFYKLLLQKETYYRLNRLVLLACLSLAFVLPLIHVPQQWALRASPAAKEITTTPALAIKSVPALTTPDAVAQQKPAAVQAQPAAAPAVPLMQQIAKWLFYLYWFGVAAFGINLLLQVAVLLIQAYKKPVIIDGRFRIVELDDDKAPCSFGNNIFINPSKYDPDTYNQILLHEKIHIRQGHSFDLFFAELSLVFQWFNPFAWLYRKEVESNLEYLADNEVLHDATVERADYQMNLLKVSVPNLSLRITTNYNQSLLKKRIVMMNAKRSNIHTTWKYLFLLPLMAFMVCALNQPVALSQSVKVATHVKTNARIDDSEDHRQGVWTAKITGSRIVMNLRKSASDEGWVNGTDFMVSEFTSLPRGQAGEFKLVRDAGTMVFNGKYDGDNGNGTYKFIPDASFITYLKSEGIEDIERNDDVALFMINVTKDYLTMLHRNGYKNVSKSDLIATRALKVDEPYIRLLKQNGFPNVDLQNLITGRALGINGAYISEIHKAGYPNISFEKLVSYKAQNITGDYITKFKKAKGTAASTKKKAPADMDGDDNGDDDDDMVAYKSLGVDDAYVNSLKSAGMNDLSKSDLIGMKALGITADYIKSFKNAGYNITGKDATSLKALGITAGYLNSFKNAGYKDINISNASGLKALGVTAEYIKGFKAVGFDNITLDQATSLKAMNITPEYISQMREKGFKSNDIGKYISLKASF